MRKILCVVLLLLLAGVVSGCEKEVKPVPYEGCIPLPEIRMTGGEYSVEPGDYFVKNQVIVTGLVTDVNRVLEEFPELEPINQVDMGYLSKYLQELPPGLEIPTRFPLNRFAELAIHLYQIPSPKPLGEVVGAIYEQAIELKEQGEIEFGVFADPNYLSGRPPPIKLSGDPDCVEGGPAGNSARAGQDLLCRQWAFDERGVSLFTGSRSQCMRSVSYTGGGVRVGIFDTSPFADQGGWTIPWIEPNLDLCVSHPGAVVPLESIEKAPDFRDHGLFVAGLVHAVAPESEIHLIRVLNAKNQGDLDTLVNALKLFTERTLNDRGTLENTVVNLSLGVHPPPDLGAAGLPPDLSELASQLTQLTMPGFPSRKNEVPTVSLETQLSIARVYGAVVVAAAGNDSAPQIPPAPPKLTQIPAAYPFVIGVAGSNIRGGRACFSNVGEVAAPSGDNGPGPSTCGSPPTCSSKVADCDDEPEYCIVSLAMHASPKTGYAYWVGTSFATPLVSGQAALLLGAEDAGPVDVRSVIRSSAVKTPDYEPSLGDGVINIQTSLP